MKIAIIEFETHIECLESLCYFFQDSTMEVHIFTNKTAAAGLEREYPLYNWHYTRAEKLKEQLKKLNSFSAIIYETVQQDLKYFAELKLSVPVILRIHNLNTWLKPDAYNWWHPLSCLKNWLKDNFWRREAHYRRLILGNVNYLNFCDSKLTEYAVLHKLAPAAKILDIPAGFFYENLPLSHQDWRNAFKIVIPGTLDPARRDYEIVYRALKKIRKRLKTNLKIIFLGKAQSRYAGQLLSRFERLSRFIQVQSYKLDIPQKLFKEFMCEAQLMLAPIKVQTAYSCYWEKYGQTKSAGAVNDVIRYSIPAIFPRKYPLPVNLVGLAEQYASSGQLAELILKYTDNTYYKDKYAQLAAKISASSHDAILKAEQELKKATGINV